MSAHQQAVMRESATQQQVLVQQRAAFHQPAGPLVNSLQDLNPGYLLPVLLLRLMKTGHGDVPEAFLLTFEWVATAAR